MWPWPWTRIFAASLALTLASPAALAESAKAGSPGHAPARRRQAPASPTPSPTAGLSPTSSGPTSPQEARVLWEDGKAAFDEGCYDDAAPRLQRLVDRYPGYPDYLEAHELLGRAFIALGRDSEAVAPLNYYAAAKGRGPEACAARLWLARARLRLGRYHEAYLSTLEVERAAPRSRPELLALALVLRARALIGLEHDARAESALDSADELLRGMGARNLPSPRPSAATGPIAASSPAATASPGASPRAPEFPLNALAGESAETRLRLRERACARFPSPGRLDEAQARDQLDRRGTCLLEALLVFRNTLDSGDEASSRDASATLSRSFADYTHACSNPPDPPRIHPRDRTALQLKRYRQELASVLRRECAAKVDQALDLARAWPGEASPPASAAAASLVRDLETLRKAQP